MSGIGHPECEECGGRGFVSLPGNSARPCECRRRLLVEKFLAGCQVPERYLECSFETYLPGDNVTFLEGLSKVRRYVDNFLDPGEARGFRESGILLTGPPGIGKTHLAVAALWEVIRRYVIRSLFVNLTDFIEAIQNSYDPDYPDSTFEIVEPVKNAPFLVLDELGAQKPTGHTQEKLYLVINHRYVKRLPTVFTTNYRLPPSGGNVRALKADPEAHLSTRVPPMLLSRIFEMAHPIEMTGPDYRQEVRRFSTAP